MGAASEYCQARAFVCLSSSDRAQCPTLPATKPELPAIRTGGCSKKSIHNACHENLCMEFIFFAPQISSQFYFPRSAHTALTPWLDHQGCGSILFSCAKRVSSFQAHYKQNVPLLALFWCLMYQLFLFRLKYRFFVFSLIYQLFVFSMHIQCFS